MIDSTTRMNSANSDRSVLGVLGMPGSGKSQIADFLRNSGLTVIRLGGFVEEEIDRRGLPRSSSSETTVRNALRDEFGKDVLARRVLEAITKDQSTSLFVLDGVYSPEEDQLLRATLGESYFTIAVLVDRSIRYQRLEVRDHRHLSNAAAAERDFQEIQSLRKADSIVLADYFVLNNDDRPALLKVTFNKIISHLSTIPGVRDLDWLRLDVDDLITQLASGKRFDESVMWELIARAQIENDSVLNWYVSKAIGDIAFTRGKQFLMKIGEEPDTEFDLSSLHRIAARSLAQIAVPINEVIPLLDSDSWQTRLFAVDVLGELADETSFGSVLALFNRESDIDVVAWTGLALAKIAKNSKNDEQIKVISSLVRTSSDYKRYIAFDALQKVDRTSAERLLEDLRRSNAINSEEETKFRTKLTV